MELLAPAGSSEKLRYAYTYGADAAYIGLPSFSLRANAENIDDKLPESPQTIRALKGERKLYCALNIYFHDVDLGALNARLDRIAEYPFDAFIVSDIGVLPTLKKRFPDAELHLSTQANCTNREAARMYHDMGFSRIVPARELSLEEIARIKDTVPELELEVFVHGAICLAYSGRCLISKWVADRSANRGDCAHSCRWNYRLALEEEQRPGEYLPVETGETAAGAFTTLLSSKDICMIDDLAALREAGVDSLKIEGRIKSLYYVAVITRAYRYALDHPGDPNPFREDLFAVSHREFSTGFYFGRDDIERPTSESYEQTHLFLGSLEEPPREIPPPRPEDTSSNSPYNHRGWSKPVYVNVRNTISNDREIELISPALPAVVFHPGDFHLFSLEGNPQRQLVNQSSGFIRLRADRLAGGAPCPGWLLRRRRDL